MVRLIYKDSFVVQEEGYNEFSVNIFWFSSVESSLELQAVLVVHPFEVVLLGWLGDKSIDVAERVFLITETIVRRNLTVSFIGVGLLVNRSDWEIYSIFLEIEIMGELITTSDEELSSIKFKSFSILIVY